MNQWWCVPKILIIHPILATRCGKISSKPAPPLTSSHLCYVIFRWRPWWTWQPFLRFRFVLQHHIEPANIISGWYLLSTHPRTLIAIFTFQHKSHFTQLSFVLAMFCFVLLWGSLCRSNLCLHHLMFWHCRPPLSVMVQCTKYCRWPKDETHSTTITSQNQRKLGNIQIVLNAWLHGGITAVETRHGICHECHECHWCKIFLGSGKIFKN